MYKLTTFGILIIFSFNSINSIPVEDDLTITSKEKHALDEFKILVKDLMPHSYMKTDIYLIKWLRANKLDLKLSREMIISNLRWREKNRMDEIMYDDFSEFEMDFPASEGSRDYTGRPVMQLDVSQWNIRKAIINGKKEKLNRYIYKLVESNVQEIYERQSRGENVTQGTTLINMKGFSLIVHACGQCIPLYINLILAFEQHFPGMAHKIVLVNTPMTFEIVLTAVKPAMSQDTKNALMIFGTNEQEWKRFIFNMIPEDQLDRQFGGNKD